MLPDFAEKKVLDIGCGFGWHCIYAAEHGAAKVIGTDISEKMLAAARKKTDSPAIIYENIAMEDLDYPPDSFDIVISSLAFHYTPDFDLICKKVNSFLKTGGCFVFSAEHPVFTAYGSQDWIYDNENNPLYWPVDNYFMPGKRESIFLGEKVVKYHRTLTEYINALIQNGFSVTKVVEPQPEEKLLETVPGMRDELRRPMMLLVSSVKV